MTTKTLIPSAIALVVAAAGFCGTAIAAGEKAGTTESAHERQCRIKAGTLARDDRAAFLKQCLSGKAPGEVDVSGVASNDARTRACREKAATKPRDDRANFMKTCTGVPEASVEDVSASPDKAKACHEKVGTVARDDRIAFMKKCLAE